MGFESGSKYRGKLLTEMTREELIDAVELLGGELTRSYNDHISNLEHMAGNWKDSPDFHARFMNHTIKGVSKMIGNIIKIG